VTRNENLGHRIHYGGWGDPGSIFENDRKFGSIICGGNKCYN